MWWWWAGCAGGTFRDSARVDSGTFGPSGALAPPTATVRLTTPDARAPLVRRLEVRADRPVTGEVRWGERRLAVDEASATWSFILLGFPAGEITEVTVDLLDDAGLGFRGVMRVDAPPAPPHFPVALVGGSAPESIRETLVPLRIPEGDPPYPRDVAAVYDRDGELVYWLDVGDTLMDVRAVDDGLVAVVGIREAKLVHFRWDGVLLESWALPPVDAQTVVQTGWSGRLHHDGGPVPDDSGRVLALARTPLEVEDYPASYEDPLLTRPRTVADDVVVLFAPDGAVEREVHLSSVLPTSRIGYGSLDATSEGWADWAHANAVEWQPDGSTLVSLRHQDLVVLLEPSGAIRWLAGHDVNLTPELQALRLQAPVDTVFPWHQHGVHLGPAGGDGTRLLTLFDNGNDRAAPYTGVPRVTDPALLSSRVVGYAVDEAARTIREAWTFSHPDGPLFSEAVGDADQLPTGHVLGVWGYLDRDPEGVPNTDAGLGHRSVRIVEFDARGASGEIGRERIVWELLLQTRREANPWGWAGARAQRVSLGDPED